MRISERIFKTVEQWQAAWKDRLRGWLVSWLMGSIKDTMEDLELKPRKELFAIFDELIASPDTPPTIRGVLEKIRAHESPAWLTTILVALGAMLAATVLSQFTPSIGGIRYAAERMAKLYRFDPMAIITAWRRDPEKYAALFDDLKDQGWDDDRIEALKFYTLFYPAPADLIRWQAREVFEPEMIARYGLDSEFEAIDKEPFYKAGMTDEQILNYWRAHWEHASWMQVVEMLHRGLLTEEQVYDWFRVVEIPPYWRDLLIKTAYTWPTRVDVRRWWDMRTIDETELRRLYSGMGYRGVNLDNYILWTKVYVAFPDLMTRWSNGWLTEDDVRGELVALGMPSDRVEEMIQTKKKAVEAGQVQGERDLTKSEIYTGVKKGVITREEGIELIEDLNYTREQAEYILDIRVGALEGSPETFEEFKDITTKYKIAIGKEEKPMPEELKKAAAEVVKLTKEVESLEEALKLEERGLMEDEALPGAATEKRDELRVTLHRAEAELQRVKTEYDSLVAQWRHGG